MSYRRFFEEHALISWLDSDSYAAGAHDLAAYVDCELYQEIVVCVNVGDMVAGATLDIDLEVASDAAGTNVQTIKSFTQLTQAGGDSNAKLCGVVAGQEMEAALAGGGFFNVEATVAVDAVEFGVMVYGRKARYEPVTVANWTETLDPS